MSGWLSWIWGGTIPSPPALPDESRKFLVIAIRQFSPEELVDGKKALSPLFTPPPPPVPPKPGRWSFIAANRSCAITIDNIKIAATKLSRSAPAAPGRNKPAFLHVSEIQDKWVKVTPDMIIGKLKSLRPAPPLRRSTSFPIENGVLGELLSKFKEKAE